MLADIEKRFESREIRAQLARNNIITDRERIAAVSDLLGIGTRNTPTGKRSWLEHEVRTLQGVFFVARNLRIRDELAVQIVQQGEAALEDHLTPIREAVRIGHASLVHAA